MTRRRFRYDPERREMVEVSRDWSDAERRAPVPTEQLVYGGLGTATDGTPIDSRTKHRNYLRATGTALASDYAESWKKAEQQRSDFYAGRHEHKGLKQAIAQAYDQVRGRKR